MKTLKATLILLVALFVTSCMPSSYLTYYKYDESTARYMNPAMTSGYITPTIADLNVSKTKISETETYKNTLTAKDMNSAENSPTIEYLKNYTVSKAVKKHNADVIVAPIFDIKTSDDFETIEVNVSGYPANFVNFRNVKAADTITLRMYNIEVAQPK
ncbi:MAG: hypothetical protein J6Q39_05625 [Bacteroidales bacterium]|nr:hypothetical protein [Bacteroidales bacterium]